MVRFLEDPVRMLRAIKFSARLDLGMSPGVYHAIVQCRGSLAMAARPRLFEEVLRLLRGGASQTSIWLAWETGVLDILLPELSTYLCDRPASDGTFWSLLRRLDKETRRRGEPLDDVVLWACLLSEPLFEACSGERDRAVAAIDFLDAIVERLSMPRRVADSVRRIVTHLPRVAANKPGRMGKTHLYGLTRQVAALLEPEPEKLNAFIDSIPRRARRKKAARDVPSAEA